MGKIMKMLKALLGMGDDTKKTVTKHHRKKGVGWRSPEEFHKNFERRYGKPGRVPEDVG